MKRICINGKLVDPERAWVSAFDYGFLYGFGLFETLRVYKGLPFALEEHFERMRREAYELGWEFPWDLSVVSEWVRLTLEGFREADLRLRLTATPGKGEPVADLSLCREPTFVVMVSVLPSDFDSKVERGLKLALFPHPRGSFSSRFKALSYMESVTAKHFAARKGADEALFVNHKGFVTECSTSNIFVVLQGGAILTPPSDLELLEGITRRFVLSLADEMGLSLQEEKFTPRIFEQCAGAFLTNSVVEVAPVFSFEGKELPPSPVIWELRKVFKRMVASRLEGNWKDLSLSTST